MSEDTRIVYGALCTWWNGIEKVGSRNGLPCCPKCKRMLFEMPSPKEWWHAVEKHKADGHPGYRDFVEWLKDKCYPNFAAAKAAYEAKGRRIDG